MKSTVVRRLSGATTLTAGLLVAATVAALAPAPSAWAAPAAMPPSDACAVLESTTRQADPVLGGGVTVTTGREGNLFPAGTRPSLQVSSLGVAGETLHLTVRDRSTTVAQLDAPASSGPVSLPSRPGWFKVLVQRRSLGGATLGSTCLWYGVAVASARLDLSSLPAGKDWGGPSALRDVQLHSQLSLPIVRRQISVADFLASPATDGGLGAASTLATKLGLKLVVQIGQGGAAETSAVADGSWGAVVRRIVAANPAVTYWEAWNEPNTAQFFSGTARDYVTKVLAPFASAVRAANPHAVVVGGTALADDSEWWTAFGKLGGFKLVNVVGVHPYTWGWGAPETQGLLSVLQSVRSLADRFGGRGKPIYDTESGFPSAWDGTGSSLWTQADYDARKIVLERTLGVLSGQFEIEGGWQDWGVIDVQRGVKPAAIAVSTTSIRLAGRSFLGWWNTRVSGVRAARFKGLTVVWSVAGSRSVPLKCTASGSDAYGASVRARRVVQVGSSPLFLTGGTKKTAGCLKGTRG